ncbi:2,3-dihydroxyphenylpropionate 1,2-dioxygenase [Phytoactinopolyspora mesophila]|uniref:2,3-dihydroxyphenylpropionate 1,2-dioxygenase n=1 Tax=Phytoactinopolyspora mesophila TaxID=2650750 RepID=A0A7K3MD70_9ACTN|nr:2,3-dihydroxyphenylpropionate 1,2-dioxygenase [Phytoactinopolyspora mesophila]NDL60348.1 2,3-dihydroxyphenylpropionate 1,2-dioxygenase [Phytoactinopolyspora mesophila]
MGQIVGAFTASHSPGITGFPERAEPAQREAVEGAFGEVRRRIEELAPDAVVAVSVEHFTNFFLGNLPAFAIGTAGSYLGPVTKEMGEFLGVEQHDYPGDAVLGAHLYRFALESDFDPALVEGGLAFDENFCVPLKHLDPGSALPLVPVIVNGVNPPWPTARRCYDFGRMIRAAVEAQDDARRVVVLGTGGLSHWVGMPEAGSVNEEFDRDFLDRLESGDPARLTDYTQEQIDAAGNGAHEIRTWLVTAGAAGVPFDTLVYEPVPAWLTGTALAAARI